MFIITTQNPVINEQIHMLKTIKSFGNTDTNYKLYDYIYSYMFINIFVYALGH